MKGDKHFSHPHPLTSFLDDMESDVADNYHSCKICGLPVLSAPSYTCTFAACDFFLHESCAQKFQEKFVHPNHDRQSVVGGLLYGEHTLCLREGSPHFTYKCEDCDFEKHPLAAAAVFGVEIKTEHKSHPPHPLVAICRETLSLCDACGERHDGFFFSCHHCDFWIHQACIMLPTAVTLPSHPLPFLLVYSIPVSTRSHNCVVCSKPLLFTYNAIYFCPQNYHFVHVRCAFENIQSKTRLELIQLPDDELDTFPSLEIRTYSQRNQTDNTGDGDKKLAIENFHKHPLILVGDGDEEEDHNYKCKLVCDICIQTITIPSRFYRCAQQSGGCSFLAHKVCSELLPIIKFATPSPFASRFYHARPCRNPGKWFFNSIFYCGFCRLPCNGPCYYFPLLMIPYYGMPFMVDLSCMAAPSIIKHISHSQHLLFRTTRRLRASPISCCSRDSILFDVYKCTICDFYIHIRCALLPKKVHFRKFDQHPLQLITTSTTTTTSSSTGSDQDICEVCEEGIELKYWFYHCAKCDYSFHVNCIPSLGFLSKVKFGGKYSMSCHSHPLTLTRMLTVGRNEKCGYCNQIIRGLVDQVAFSCSHCDCWIHFSCANDSLTPVEYRTSLGFGEINEHAICDVFKLD